MFKCVICIKLRTPPASPLMSDSPSSRLTFKQRPFTLCGVDYFGPMLVKIGKRQEKRWGVIFTCVTTMHLELAHSLNTDTAIMALQRLSARRGVPSFTYSDNSTNFRGANKELKQAILSVNIDDLTE